MKQSKKRSVLMVCSQMPPVYGGAGTQAALLGRTLARMGWDVSAVTLDQASVKSGTEGGVRFRRLMRGITPTGGVSRACTTVALGVGAFLLIVARRPTVVHIHGAYWWSILPAIAGRLVGSRILVKLTRDGEDDAVTVYSKRVGRISVGRLYGLSLTLADVIIVLNEASRKIAASRGLGDRVHLIPNGVDDAHLARTTSRRVESRAAKSLSGDDRVVIFVGYLARHKGVIDLLDAWRIIGNRTTHLWLVGPFEGFYRELDDDVPRFIDECAREGYRITTFGHVPAADLPELYWAADVFTLPSYAEGMPNSMAEALVAGCHVVATRIPGIADIMGSENPDLVTPGDAHALANRLATAIDAPRSAPSELVERLSISSVARRYEQLYLEPTSAVRQ